MWHKWHDRPCTKATQRMYRGFGTVYRCGGHPCTAGKDTVHQHPHRPPPGALEPVREAASRHTALMCAAGVRQRAGQAQWDANGRLRFFAVLANLPLDTVKHFRGHPNCESFQGQMGAGQLADSSNRGPGLLVTCWFLPWLVAKK